MKHDAKSTPSDAAVGAWVKLVRAEQVLLERIEAELKAAGFPPLSWYDVLLELGRSARGELRPVELERHTLLAQYNASRLIDRMEKAGLVARKANPEDGRSQLVASTAEGRALQKRMWRVYGAAISRHVDAKLSAAEAGQLATLLTKLLEAEG